MMKTWERLRRETASLKTRRKKKRFSKEKESVLMADAAKRWRADVRDGKPLTCSILNGLLLLRRLFMRRTPITIRQSDCWSVKSRLLLHKSLSLLLACKV